MPIPRISVVMPMRNAEAYVRESIASVLSQSEADFELVVVDDGSTDQSGLIAASFRDSRIRIIEGPGRGFAASFNTGVLASKASIVMECDADDLLPPNRIREQVLWLDANPTAAAVCGRFSTIDSRGRPVADLVNDSSQQTEKFISAELSAGVVRTAFCTYATRRDAFEELGLFREYFESGPDIDLQLRMGEACVVGFLPRLFYLYRLHETSITHQQVSRRREFFESMAYRFQAERRSGMPDSLAQDRPPPPPAVTNTDRPSTAAAQVHGMLNGRAWSELRSGRCLAAIKTSVRALSVTPRELGAWVSTLKVFVRAVQAAVVRSKH